MTGHGTRASTGSVSPWPKSCHARARYIDCPYVTFSHSSKRNNDANIGEMHFLPSGPNSWYNLPREKGVAYAAQESWVENETIRDNILFGAPYDEERYKKGMCLFSCSGYDSFLRLLQVIYQCGLERDLTLFDAGDQTEVGEKGLTLRSVLI